MKKKRKVESLNIVDLPQDVIKIIVSYSPREWLQISKMFCKIVRSLRTQIKVADCKKYNFPTNSILNTIFSSHNISTLNVSGWTKWTDSSLQYLARMIKIGHFKNLSMIYMRNCNNVSNKSLHILLPAIAKNLKLLDIFNCKNINYKAFGLANENLESLYLGYSKTSDVPADNANVLEYFFNNILNTKPLILFPKLERLQLFNFSGIKSLYPLVHVAKSLKFLDIRGCTAIDPAEFKHISALTRLENLQIGMNVDNDTLLDIINSCNNISVLDISGSQISSEVVEAICSKLSSLSRLKLTKCTTINNEFLSSILSSLSHLCLIDVSHCWRLTNSLFDMIYKIPSGNKLSKIGIYMCSLDSSKLVYRFNCAGANNIIPVIHGELQIDIT